MKYKMPLSYYQALAEVRKAFFKEEEKEKEEKKKQKKVKSK